MLENDIQRMNGNIHSTPFYRAQNPGYKKSSVPTLN